MRLSEATLGDLPKTVRRPAYDRAQIETGLVHLGIGAFHRAHQAVYTDDVLASGDRRWGIVGASFRSPAMRDALKPQDGLYTLWTRGEEGETLRVIGSVRDVLVAPEDPEALLSLLCRPSVRIVSLTVTEKGYCLLPATGLLDENHPDLRHDCAHPDRPRSAPGFIVAAIARRRAAGLPPFTLLSCDNLPRNGQTLRGIVSRLAALRDPALGRFIEDEVRFPSTMVDRIAPATTDADRDAVAARLGIADAWPVVTEPFSHWVIEDSFGPGGRPAWEEAGAVFTADIAPFDLMKLRMINTAHSLLAYLGFLAGHETIADAAAAAGFAPLVRAMIDREVTPELQPIAGLDLEAHKALVMARFGNRLVRHRTAQSVTDGSQKMPQRFLPTIRARLARDAPFDRLALGVAAWMRCMIGWDEQGKPLDVRDPLTDEIRRRTAGMRDAKPLVEAFLGIEKVFGADLPAHPRFRDVLEHQFADLLRGGAAATVLERSHRE